MRAFREIPTDTSHRADSETIFTGADTTGGFDTGFVMSGPASIPAERLLPASVKPGPAGYPPVKVRAAAADLLPERSLYHQETQSMVKDYLKYDEVPGVTTTYVDLVQALTGGRGGLRDDGHDDDDVVVTAARIVFRERQLHWNNHAVTAIELWGQARGLGDTYS